MKRGKGTEGSKGSKGNSQLPINQLHCPALLPLRSSVHIPWQRALASVWLIGLSMLMGCGNEKSSVSGTVTFDGEPVKNGSITFVKPEGELVREGAVIRDGAFQASLPPGEYKIELAAQKVTGKRTQKGFDGKDEEVEETKELFPERYNTKTTLTRKINRGANTVNLNATTK